MGSSARIYKNYLKINFFSIVIVCGKLVILTTKTSSNKLVSTRLRTWWKILPSKTNVPFKILRTGTVGRYFLRICVCQGQYSVGTAGWCTLNWLCSYNEHGHHEFTVRETVVPLPSLRRGLKLIVCVHMRPAQYQTIVPTLQWSIIVQVSYFEMQWRDGRGTVICRILN